MKVALFLPSLTIGGVQRVIVNLANGLDKLGCNITIIVCDGQGEMRKKLPSNSKIIDFNKKKLHGDLRPIFSAKELEKYLKQNKIDCLISAPGFSSVIALKVAKKLKTNTSILLIADNKLSLMLKRKFRNKVNYYLLKFYSKKVRAHIIAVHQSAYDDALKIFKKSKFKIHKIYHPIIENLTKEKIKDKNLDNILTNNNIIISAGRLVYEKNYILLIKAFEKLLKDYPSYKLLILGDGNLKDSLNNYCKEHNLCKSVYLYGFSNYVIESMKKSKLYVSSSIEEAFGNCIVEALSTGVRIVSTDVESGGPFEILGGGKYGRLCRNNDVNDLYKSMKKELENETSSKEERIKRSKDFSVEASAKKYYQLMKGLKNETK